MEIQNVVGITVICYAVGMACKSVDSVPDKMIPVIVAVAGGLLGAAGLYIMPEYPAGNMIDAVAVGIASGLSAVGIDQIKKQLGGKGR